MSGKRRMLHQRGPSGWRPGRRRQAPFDRRHEPVEDDPCLQMNTGPRHVDGIIEQSRIPRIGRRDIDEVEMVGSTRTSGRHGSGSRGSAACARTKTARMSCSGTRTDRRREPGPRPCRVDQPGERGHHQAGAVLFERPTNGFQVAENRRQGDGQTRIVEIWVLLVEVARPVDLERGLGRFRARVRRLPHHVQDAVCQRRIRHQAAAHQAERATAAGLRRRQEVIRPELIRALVIDERSGSIGTSSCRTIAWKLREVSASRPALTTSMATPSLRDPAHLLSQNPTSSGYEYGSA